jgi:hypothetical protein
MTIRTTVAFDLPTVTRLERLAKHWGVSKSETLRRALESAEKSQLPTTQGSMDFSHMTPLEIFEWLSANPQVPSGWAEEFRREIQESRAGDEEIETERETARV